MASEIRVNQIQNRSGLSTVTFSDTGVVVSGITTITDLRASGNTIVAAGTTSTPSISPIGDSNTGIFFPSADTIAFAEGGVEALRINSSANVGIGTTNPTTTLQVNGTTKVETSIGSTQSIWSTSLDSKNYSATNVSLLVSPEKAYFHNSSLPSSRYEPVVVSAALTTNNGSNFGLLYTLQNFTNVAGTSSTARILAVGNANSVLRNSTTDISSFTSNFLYGSYNQVAQGSNVDQSVVTGTIITDSNVVNVEKATATTIFGNSSQIRVGNSPNNSANSTNVYNSYTQGVVGASSGTGIGTVTNLYSYYADAAIFLTGRVSNYYGLYLSGPLLYGGTLTNRYSIFSSDTSSPMYHAGSVGIGITNPSQKLEVLGGEIKAGRVDGINEGGQVSFGRATDNATGWYIDVFGNTSTPSLRFVDVSNSAVRMTIDDSGRLTMPYQPYAIITLSSGNVGAFNNKVGPGATTVIGTNIVSNNFSLYNSSNGRFTAPVTGLYEFGFSSNLYVNTASNWIMFNTYKNGSLYLNHYSDKIASNWQYVAFSDKIVLNANDYVDLRLQTDTGTLGADLNTYTQINFRLIG